MTRTREKWLTRIWRAAVIFAVVFLNLRVSPAPDAEKLEVADPFADPRRYTVLFQLIEIDRADWNAWLANPKNSTAGPDLRAHLQTLLKDGKATLIDSAMAVCSHGEPVELASVGEYIFPSEGDPAELAQTGTAMTHRVAGAYATRNTGLEVTLKVTGPQRRVINRRTVWTGSEVVFQFDRVLRLRNDSHGVGANERKMPVFHTLRHRGTIRYLPGKPVLISSHRPDKAAGENRKNPVVLAFLQLDPIELSE